MLSLVCIRPGKHIYLRKKCFLWSSLQPIKVEHLYGIAADVKVFNKKLKIESNIFIVRVTMDFLLTELTFH